MLFKWLIVRKVDIVGGIRTWIYKRMKRSYHYKPATYYITVWWVVKMSKKSLLQIDRIDYVSIFAIKWINGGTV